MDTKANPCKRPYSLGKRMEQSDSRKAKILAVAKAQLKSGGLPGLTLDVLARESGVTRQTVHNLFRTKTGVVEALFDQIALSGGMEQMRSVMQQISPAAMLTGFVEVFTDFWRRDRLLIRRIHGIAAVDLEFQAVLEARNRRRRAGAERVIDVLGGEGNRQKRSALLYALTSFEFFDVVADGCGDADEAAAMVLEIATKAIGEKTQAVSDLGN